MNKKISSRLALFIILGLAIFFMLTFWIMGEKNNARKYYTAPVISIGKNIPQQQKCLIKAYANKSAKIKIWMDGNKNIHVANESLNILPDYSNTAEFKKENSIIKIVDISSQTEKELAASSSAKPSEVTITGFARTCKGYALASLNYKDGIFKNYLN